MIGRLLPWTGEDSKPGYLMGDGTGYVSRLADRTESMHLGMADDLLDHAAGVLAEQRLTAEELRYLAGRLSGSLWDVKRVAESRGGAVAGLTLDLVQGPECRVWRTTCAASGRWPATVAWA